MTSLCSKNPVAAGLQADGFAGLQFPVARRVDLDHGVALAAAQRHFRALDRAERADVLDRSLQRPAAHRADLHVVAADKQLCRPGSGTVGSEIERLAIEPDMTVA